MRARTPRFRVRAARRMVQAVLVVLALVAVPDGAVHPAALSVIGLADAHAVDFDEGIVWFLVLGSDAREGEEVMEGRADAIELVGLDFGTGRAVAVAVPRDTWVDLPGHGFDRINAALPLDGPALVADAVESLVGIAPDYVITSGFDGFVSMVDSIGPVTVLSRHSFRSPDSPREVRRGLNRMDGPEALAFARARVPLTRGDFDRASNHQELMKGILRSLRAGKDGEGFLERGSYAALRGLDTDLSPVELYRLAQAVTTFRLSRVTDCVLAASPGVENGASVVYVDPALARRVGDDIRGDARLDGGCG